MPISCTVSTDMGTWLCFSRVSLSSLLSAPSSQPVPGGASWAFLEEPLKQRSGGGVAAGMPW